jgi:hypothetical protein
MGAVDLSKDDRRPHDSVTGLLYTPDQRRLEMLCGFLSNEAGCRCVLLACDEPLAKRDCQIRHRYALTSTVKRGRIHPTMLNKVPERRATNGILRCFP